MTTRRTDLLFHAGGEAVEQYGTIVRKTLRDDDNGYTSTRSGAIGPYVDYDGVIRTAGANVPRIDWQDGDAYLLLEDSRTNLVSTDDLTAWTAVRTPTVTGSVSDPAGGTGAYTIDDSGAGDWEYIYHVVTFTGDSTTTAVFVVRENTMPASGSQDLLVQDSTAGAARLRLEITAWSNGEPTVSASTGTYLGKRKVGNGYWAIYGEATGVVVGNTNRLQIEPANSNSVSGSLDVYRANAYNDNAPGFSILDASEARSADEFYAGFPYPPQEMTVYAQWHEAGTAFISGFPSIVEVGDSATDGTIQIRRDNSSGDGRYECVLQADGSQVSVSEPSATVTYGDSVEFVAQVASSGSVTGVMSVNGAAIVTGSAGSTGTLPTSFTNDRVELGDAGVSAIRSVKVARGIKTMAQMRAL